MYMRLIRRRLSMGATAALLGAALVLSACGGDNESDVPPPPAEQPAPQEPAVEEPATEETTPEVETETEGEGEGVVGSETVTESEVITESGIVTAEVITETTVVTEANVVTEVEVMTEGEEMTGVEGVTGTEEMTGTEETTDTEGTTGNEGTTGSQQQEGETAAAAASAAGAAAAAATGAGISGAENAFVRASTLLDYDFENADGQVSGEIEDLIMDLDSGQVLFVPIEYGGVLEIGDTDIALPLSAFRIGEEGELVLNFDEQALENFPDLGGDWPNLDDPTWDDDINAFWSEQGIETGVDVQEASGNVARASELLGFQVADWGQGPGTVQDIIINLGTGRAEYLLVGSDAGVDGPIAVPFSAFDMAQRDTELTWGADFNQEWMADAPRFDIERWGPDVPLDATWDDDFNTFWSEHGFEVGEE